MALLELITGTNIMNGEALVDEILASEYGAEFVTAWNDGDEMEADIIALRFFNNDENKITPVMNHCFGEVA